MPMQSKTPVGMTIERKYGSNEQTERPKAWFSRTRQGTYVALHRFTRRFLVVMLAWYM